MTKCDDHISHYLFWSHFARSAAVPASEYCSCHDACERCDGWWMVVKGASTWQNESSTDSSSYSEYVLKSDALDFTNDQPGRQWYDREETRKRANGSTRKMRRAWNFGPSLFSLYSGSYPEYSRRTSMQSQLPNQPDPRLFHLAFHRLLLRR